MCSILILICGICMALCQRRHDGYARSVPSDVRVHRALTQSQSCTFSYAMLDLGGTRWNFDICACRCSAGQVCFQTYTTTRDGVRNTCFQRHLSRTLTRNAAGMTSDPSGIWMQHCHRAILKHPCIQHWLSPPVGQADHTICH